MLRNTQKYLEVNDEGTEVYFILTDHLGSTSLTYRTSDGQTAAQKYKPWGETRQGSGELPTDRTFQGQRDDSYINMLWFGSRWYDPALGRFNQPDSIVPLEMQGVQAWNRYAFVNNNPIRFTDPTGHEICDEFGFCFEKGKLSKGDPVDFFLQVMYRSPIHDENQREPHGMGDDRGEYCYPNGGPCTGEVAFHPGLDMGSDPKTNIFAAAPGVVVFTGETDMGYTIVIEHDVFGTKIYTVYGHLGTHEGGRDNAILVKKEQPVSYDTHIGELGNTLPNGVTSDPHLHFEARKAVNINLASNSDPMSGKQWWIFRNDVTGSFVVCAKWGSCFVDFSSIYGFDPTYNPVYIKNK
jgi:RHS repeat-associated protein